MCEYSKGEELANTITHAVGLLLSVAGLSVLVVFASLFGTTWHIVSCSIYGATLVLLFKSSTIYHLVRSPHAKKVCQILDHSSIFLLIAGTYTPFTLGPLRGPWGWWLFGIVWGLALAGVICELFFTRRFRMVSLPIYLIMGWLIVVAIKPFVATVPLGGLIWLAAGGLAYSFGAIFYAWKSLPYGHMIWHLFVLAGSICHYFSIMFYVVLRK
jgi:hemolysin III